MPKRTKLPHQMINLFDFAAMNPMEGPLLNNQLMLPVVMLQSLEMQEREMHRMSSALANDAEKVAQQHHEEKHSVASTEDSVSTEEVFHTSFNLVYYNPGTEETEVIKEEVGVSLADYSEKHRTGAGKAKTAENLAADTKAGKSKAGQPKQIDYSLPPQSTPLTAMALDQSVGQKSTYPLYMNVATPLARQVVDPIKLEAALKKIEIESPKPFGGSPGMIIAPQVFDKVEAQIEKEGIEQEIVAIDTLKQVEGLRSETLTQLDKQIKGFEYVIEELEVTDISMKNLVKELPPLSKARYLALLKHEKKIAESIVVDMLIADLEFLVVLKANISKSGLRGLLNTLKKLGKVPALRVKSGGGGDDEEGEEEKKKD